MTYTVLARKYRPKSFASLVGQESAVRTLSNALTKNRLHHAYLLTGTRGVGKTTLGRILAKCFNCHAGVSATPCGTCASCQEIDSGHSLDLIEIDAASNTKVEDTRSLLDNVQYAPSRDRYKIYLIDEVHMLSNHSFNALLKTLEEPPEHVKFILATTDPQKLPITILSRCLQFNLRAMPATQIQAHLTDVLQQEKISAEPSALLALSHAAKGSMRDALSLLDQAIAFSNGKVTADDVHIMLGDIQSQHLIDILQALQHSNANQLLQCINTIAARAIDYQQALDALLSLLHHIALAQSIPDSITADQPDAASITAFASAFSKEHIQLLYQIALLGQRDLPLAPAPNVGFEMVLLRMLSFAPNNTTQPLTTATKATAPTTAAAPVAAKPAVAQPVAVNPAPAKSATGDQSWEQLVAQANLSGMTKVLATHCALKKLSEQELELIVDPSHGAMASPAQQQKLQAALEPVLGRAIRVKITVSEQTQDTPAKKQQRASDEKQQQAVENISNDPNVQEFMNQFGAHIQPELIISK